MLSVVMVMVMVMGFVLMLVSVIVFMVRFDGLRLIAVPNQSDAEYPRYNGGDETDHWPDDGDDRPEERIGHENRVGTRLGRRDEERQARRPRRTFAAHLRHHRHNRAAA